MNSHCYVQYSSKHPLSATVFSDFLVDLTFCLIVSHVEHICVKLFIFYLIFKVAFDMELKCLEDTNSVVPNCLFKCPEGYEESSIDPLLYRPLYKY